MGEQLHERADTHPPADVRGRVVEKLVQRLLGVTESAFEMWVVAAPDRVGVPTPVIAMTELRESCWNEA